MTHNIEIDNLKSQSKLIAPNTLSLNLIDPNPKDELLKSDMMKKLSLKEKWLNEQASLAPKVVPMEIDSSAREEKKKDEKKSFFTGIFSSVKHLIKHDKDKEKGDKHKSTSPPSGESVDLDKLVENEKIDIDNFDELVVESDKPVPGCVNKRIQAFLQKQKSEEIREDADDILNDIKMGNDRMAKQMRDMEQKRFSDNMKAIKSSVVDSKVASMKEVKNISKYFPSAQEKKPPVVAKNRDVKALKDVNLSKYFPPSPTPARKVSGSPNANSATSSAAASPLTPRKNINEIDLANYFPGTPVLTRKNSVSTPPGSPMSEIAPTFERRFSITNSIPPPPPPPIAKRNALANQTVKKRQPANENVDSNLQVKKETSPAKSSPKPQVKRANLKDFNMFDQLLDGALDLKMIEEKAEIDFDNFESLIGEVKLERSTSKEYDKIVGNGLGKGKSGSTEISPENLSKKRPSLERDELVPEAKKVIKKKKKSPKVEKNEFLDKLSIDPKIFQTLTNEYQRLLVELERSSKSADTEESIEQSQTPEPKLEEIITPEVAPTRLDNKRKSPQRFEDRKKFREELDEIKQTAEVKVEPEDDSVLARLERKYRRGSLKSIEEVPKQEEEVAVPKIEAPPSPEIVAIVESQSCSVIERLERKLKMKREKAASFDAADEIIKEPPKLNSVNLVKSQCELQEATKVPITKQQSIDATIKEPTVATPKSIGKPKSVSPHKSVSPQKSLEKVAKPPRKAKPSNEPSPTPVKQQEVNCFEKLLSLPRENINDIFADFEMTEREAKNVLKEFQESFDMLTTDEGESAQINNNLLDAVASLPRENDFDFSFATTSKEIKAFKPEIAKIESIEKDKKPDSQHESKVGRKQNRKSLQMDLAEIDFGISERPLNLDGLFPRRSSIEEIPDSPKSLNSSDDSKVVSAKDSAYSGSRKSSAGEKEIQETVTQKTESTASYINVLKEITSGLIGLDDEPVTFMEPQLQSAKKVQEPPKSNDSYTKALHDISSTLVGLDLHGVDVKAKNYSQIIPPFVQDPMQIRKAPSSNNLDVPNADRVLDFYSDTEEVIDIEIPVPPVRRHKSVESSVAAEPLRTRRLLPASKSFDYDTVSGRTSKNSTEYYDHYYPTTTTARRLEKYEPPARKDSLDGGIRTRTRQRAIDDLMVKSAKTRMYEVDDVPVRSRYLEHRRESSEPSDGNLLLEKSHMLHRRKESFMRDQMNESSNPYIREMMKQDVDNPIDISDIQFIRKHPSTALPSSNNFSSYRPASYVPSTRPTSAYAKSSGLSHTHTPITTSSYARPSTIHHVSSYKPSVASSSYLNPSSNTASHILTKSHTLSPHTGSSSYNNSYSTRSRPLTSLSDPHTSTSSRMMSHSRPTTNYSQKKSSGASRDACVIS